MIDAGQDLVLCDIDGAVATVTLNRPMRHNSLVPELLRQLLDAITRCEEHPTARVIVLRANGNSFSTGGDLQGFLDHADDIGAYSSELVGLLNQAILKLVDSNLPVIAAIDGQVTGGSLGLALAADVVLVTERASFTPYYVEVGFSPDGGWTALLPGVIGAKRAMAVQLLNQTISAQQSLDWGLAAAYTDSPTLDDAIGELVDELDRKKAGSVSRTRRLIRPHDIEARLEEERRQFVEQITTDEAINGIRTFLAKK